MADKAPEGIWNTYEKGKKLNKSCPKCGSGFSLAAHKERLYCGSCHYTEFIKKDVPKAEEKKEKPKKEHKKEAPKPEAKPAEKKEEPKPEAPKEEKKPEPKKEEPKPAEKKEEPKQEEKN